MHAAHGKAVALVVGVLAHAVSAVGHGPVDGVVAAASSNARPYRTNKLIASPS
ncbi:hypothetical protein [Treponema sp. R8-4-B8]